MTRRTQRHVLIDCCISARGSLVDTLVVDANLPAQTDTRHIQQCSKGDTKTKCGQYVIGMNQTEMHLNLVKMAVVTQHTTARIGRCSTRSYAHQTAPVPQRAIHVHNWLAPTAA